MSVIRKITVPVLRFLTQLVVKPMAAFPWPRKLLNQLYLKLSSSNRWIFHRLFAKMFRSNGMIKGREGCWKVRFANREIQMPMSAEKFWLEWDTAISIIGNDIEVKDAYEALIRSSSERPELFIDIGANYGTHSLLFLTQGIPTITFEPNSSCHGYFLRACSMNSVTPRVEHIALGNNKGHVDLAYPPEDTWLGSINVDIKKELGESRELVHEKVELRFLDDYLDEMKGHKVLIKIDTEGNELAVLQGAARTIQACRPKFIFECWRSNRTEIFDFFQKNNYNIYRLPWAPEQNDGPLDSKAFPEAAALNFIAIPDARTAS